MKHLVLITLAVLLFPLLACGQQVAEQDFQLDISPALLFIMTSTPLPSGQMGVGYNTTLTAMGGIPPYSWLVLTGSLPSGLVLGALDGILAGTPTVTGFFTFTIEVTDSAGSAATQRFYFGKKPKKTAEAIG